MDFIGYDLWCTLLFAGVVFMLLYELLSPSSQDGVKENPLDVLRKKYASVEISTEAYKERKEVLERDLKK